MYAHHRKLRHALRIAFLLGMLGAFTVPLTPRVAAQTITEQCGGWIQDQQSIVAKIYTGGVFNIVMTYPPQPQYLQPAINFAESGALGGEVTIPGGLYNLTNPLVIHSGRITIRGNGHGGTSANPTIIRRSNGASVFTGQGTELTIKNMSIESTIGSALDFAPMLKGRFYCLALAVGTRGIALSSSSGTASSQNWVFDSIISTSSTLFGGIEINGNQNNIRRVTFQSPGRAIEVTGDLNVIEQNTATASTTAAIKADGASNSVLNNTISGANNDEAITVISGGSGTAVVAHNTIAGVTTGITIEGQGDADVSFNEISECITGIRMRAGDNLLVSHNTIEECSNVGIWSSKGNGHEISDNILTHPGDQGILLDVSDGNTVTRNTIFNPARQGIRARLASNGNTINQNNIELSDLEGILIDAGSNSTISSNELFCNNRAMDPAFPFSIRVEEGSGNLIDQNNIHFFMGPPTISVPEGNTVGNNPESPC